VVVAKPPPAPPPAPGNGGGGAPAPFHPPSNSTFAARFYAAATTFGHNIPYVYGGKSTSGADCSGFIWLVLQKVAPGTPYRSSGALDSWTTSITQAQAVPGDLVFWPGHAAIYAGNGQVLSQGGPGAGPTIQDLWPGYSFGRIPL
jgi:cell wall-associated NlpC family hydrolase